MRYLLLLILSTLNFISCKVRVITEKTENGLLVAKYKVLKKNNEKNGYYRIYHENGKLALEMNYKNGKQHGKERSYYENGQLQSIARSVMGSYEGAFKYWYATSIIKQEGNYINNNIEGELKTYYPNGTLKEIVSFSRTLENGPYTIYYQNGKLKEEGCFLNGPFPDGTIKHYNDEGGLIRKQHCENGTCKVVWESNPNDKK